MISPSPTLRFFAGSLIAYEASLAPSALAVLPSAFPVTEKLRPVIATYVGRSGYHALIYRSLILAREEVPWLGKVEISADGSLKNLTDLAIHEDSDEASAGNEILLARLLELMVAFIGEILIQQLVHDLWPVLPNDIDFNSSSSYD